MCIEHIKEVLSKLFKLFDTLVKIEETLIILKVINTSF